MTPEQRYQQDLQQGNIEANAEQAKTIAILQQVYESYFAHAHNGFTNKLKALLDFDREPFQGLYLYGGVGAGKTYLMDIFYYSLPEGKKNAYSFSSIHAGDPTPT